MENKKNESTNTKSGLELKHILKHLSIKKIIKYLFILLIIAVYALILGRILLSKPTGVMKSYVYTQTSVEQINASPDNLELLTQQITKKIDDNGYYHISDFVYVPRIGELQFTLRYNNSTVDALKTFYPDFVRAGETFVCTLSDKNGNVYDEYKFISSSNIIYNFRRIVFEGVDFDNAGTLYLNIYYVSDISESSPMHVSFLLYDDEKTSTQSKIKADKTNPKVNSFNNSPAFTHK